MDKPRPCEEGCCPLRETECCDGKDTNWPHPPPPEDQGSENDNYPDDEEGWIKANNWPDPDACNSKGPIGPFKDPKYPIDDIGPHPI